MLKRKVHEAKEGIILALCDEELLGKKYKEGEMVIDLDRYGSFYDGDSVSEDHSLGELVKTVSSINAIGKSSIEKLGSLGFDIENSKEIEEVPHLQVFVIKD